MSLKLPPYLAALLREVVGHRRPDLIPSIEGSRKLETAEREALRETLADELSSSGLDKDDEPSQRGRQLEELIDRLGRL